MSADRTGGTSARRQGLLAALLPVAGLLFVFLLLLILIALFVPENVEHYLAFKNIKTILKQAVIVGIGADREAACEDAHDLPVEVPSVQSAALLKVLELAQRRRF